MARYSILASAVVLLVLPCGGCGGGNDTAAEIPQQTPGDLVAELSRRAGAGDVDALVDLLSADARNQTGRDWIQFARRTGSERTLRGFMALPRNMRQALESAATEQFMRQFQAEAPDAFGKLFFDLYYSAEYEEDGRLLVYMSNGRGYIVYLAMARQEDGTLRLLGEAQSKKVLSALREKLKAKQKADRDAERKAAREADAREADNPQ